eukprot:4183513-Pleurochrysis_carterae.AAC.1
MGPASSGTFPRSLLPFFHLRHSFATLITPKCLPVITAVRALIHRVLYEPRVLTHATRLSERRAGTSSCLRAWPPSFWRRWKLRQRSLRRCTRRRPSACSRARPFSASSWTRAGGAHAQTCLLYTSDAADDTPC